MVEKLQLRMKEVTSVRQYSFGLAAAGVVATKAGASNTAADVMIILKSYFIFISLFRRTSGGPGTPSVVPRRRIMLFQQIIRPRAGWKRRQVFDLAALTFRNSLSVKCLSAPARTSKVPNSFDQSPRRPGLL
jgi:hypothetical protein